MKRDIFGDFFVEPSDYVDCVVNDLHPSKKLKVFVNHQSTHSISIQGKISKTGIYAIYRNDTLCYIGCTLDSVHNRVMRFAIAVNDTERNDETHSAAYKYVKAFGRDVNNLYVSVCEITLKNVIGNIQLEDIEEKVIENMRPLFNEQTYNMYSIQNVNVITDLKTGIECYA